jgi:hypothetical protein
MVVTKNIAHYIVITIYAGLFGRFSASGRDRIFVAIESAARKCPRASTMSPCGTQLQ